MVIYAYQWKKTKRRSLRSVKARLAQAYLVYSTVLQQHPVVTWGFMESHDKSIYLVLHFELGTL